MELTTRPTIRRALAFAALALVTTGTSHAIRMLQPGPQTLGGVLIQAARGFQLVIDVGSRSQQEIDIELPVGNETLRTWFSSKAVPPEQYPSMYEGAERVELEGELKGQGFGNMKFYVSRAPGEDATSVEAQEILRRWQSMARQRLATPNGPRIQSALRILDRAGFLREMAEEATRADQ